MRQEGQKAFPRATPCRFPGNTGSNYERRDDEREFGKGWKGDGEEERGEGSTKNEGKRGKRPRPGLGLTGGAGLRNTGLPAAAQTGRGGSLMNWCSIWKKRKKKI